MPLPGVGAAAGMPQIPGNRCTALLLLPANSSTAQGYIRRGPYTAYRVPETAGLTVERVGAGGAQAIEITDHWYFPARSDAIEGAIVQDVGNGQNFTVIAIRKYGTFLELLTKSSLPLNQ